MIDQKLDMLRHMLGLPAWVWKDEPRKPPYRDYAAATPGDPLFIEMEAAGLVRCYRRVDKDTQFEWWETTSEGKIAAFASVEQRTRTKAARKYDRWMTISDAIGMSFGEYLKSNDPDIVEHRNG